MEKNMKKIRTVALILVIVLISLIAFVGIFRKSLNSMKNIIPDYKLGMELEGGRELKFAVDTTSEEKQVYVNDEGEILGFVKETEKTEEEVSEESNVAEEEEVSYATETRTIKANEDDALTIDNFEATKKIIQKRLNQAGVSEYNIRLNNISGELVVEVPDNDEVSSIYQLIESKGKVELIDKQTGIILIGSEHIEKASAVYSNDEGLQAFLQLNFDETGKEKLKEISNQYVEVTDETGEKTKTYVEVDLDKEPLLTTYFGEELPTGIIQIPMGSKTQDTEEFQSIYKTTAYIANIINNGQTPVVYKLSSDNFIKSVVTDNVKNLAIIVAIVILVIISIVAIIKYKANGVIAVISNIGFIAVTSLALRFTNVSITYNSIIVFVFANIMNLAFLNLLLKELQNSSIEKVYMGVMKKYYLSIIPVGIIAVVFTFMENISVSSIGMVIFWSLFVQVLYNLLFTRTMYLGKKK